jgi:hypothetical protein
MFGSCRYCLYLDFKRQYLKIILSPVMIYKYVPMYYVTYISRVDEWIDELLIKPVFNVSFMQILPIPLF